MTRTRRTLRTAATWMCLALASAPAWAKESWQALPAETVFALRIPNGSVAADQLRQRTQLGKVMLDPKRMTTVQEMIQKKDPQEWAKIQRKLNEWQLTVDDLPRILAGESGLAVVLTPQQGGEPVLNLLLWVEPGQPLAGKLLTAWGQSIEESQKKGREIKRVDIDLEGLKVMHLSEPKYELRPKQMQPAPPGMNPQQRAEWFRQQRQRMQENPDKVAVGSNDMLVTQFEGKLLVAVAAPMGRGPANVDGAAPAVDGGAQLAQLTKTLAQFIAAHKGADGQFAARVLGTPGLQDALPRGTALFEILFDTQQVVSAFKNQGNAAQVGRIMTSLGLDKVGAMGMRTSLEGQVMRSGSFIQVPAPRAGLVEVFEKSVQPAEIPAWVPASAVSYQHIGLDLGLLYNVIRTVSIQEGGEQAKAGFDMADTQLQGMLQTDLKTLLASLGSRHALVTFNMPAEAPAPGPNGEPDVAALQQPQAFVWQLQNEAVWNNVFTMIEQQFVPSGMLQKCEEQGFTGFRNAPGNPELGIFRGKGYLVFAMGKGTSEKVLAALRNPPQGDAALANSPSYLAARQLVSGKPGLAYGYADLDRYMDDVSRILNMVMAEASKKGGEDKEVVEMLKQVLPSGEELHGMFKGSASNAYFTEQGLVGEGAAELSPAR